MEIPSEVKAGDPELRVKASRIMQHNLQMAILIMQGRKHIPWAQSHTHLAPRTDSGEFSCSIYKKIITDDVFVQDTPAHYG